MNIVFFTHESIPKLFFTVKPKERIVMKKSTQPARRKSAGAIAAKLKKSATAKASAKSPKSAHKSAHNSAHRSAHASVGKSGNSHRSQAPRRAPDAGKGQSPGGEGSREFPDAVYLDR